MVAGATVSNADGAAGGLREQVAGGRRGAGAAARPGHRLGPRRRGGHHRPRREAARAAGEAPAQLAALAGACARACLRTTLQARAPAPRRR